MWSPFCAQTLSMSLPPPQWILATFWVMSRPCTRPFWVAEVSGSVSLQLPTSTSPTQHHWNVLSPYCVLDPALGDIHMWFHWLQEPPDLYFCLFSDFYLEPLLSSYEFPPTIHVFWNTIRLHRLCIGLTGFEAWLFHLEAGLPCAYYVAFQCLSFLIYMSSDSPYLVIEPNTYYQ